MTLLVEVALPNLVTNLVGLVNALNSTDAKYILQHRGGWTFSVHPVSGDPAELEVAVDMISSEDTVVDFRWEYD